MTSGISICILTYNVLFYNRLALDQIRKLSGGSFNYEILIYDNGSTDGSVEFLEEQDDVRLFKGSGNSMRHGEALDYLVKKADKPYCCTLCSDAFPVSDEWLTPVWYLGGDTVLAGIDRGWGRKLKHYVCPSYLFGCTEWLRNHTFVDKWPEVDTGEQMGLDCKAEGKRMQLWKSSYPDWDGKFKDNKPCDYNGWVWHTWWGGRSQSIPGLAGREFEEEYHEHVKNMLRERYNLDY